MTGPELNDRLKDLDAKRVDASNIVYATVPVMDHRWATMRKILSAHMLARIAAEREFRDGTKPRR